MSKYTILRTTDEEKAQLKKDAHRHERNVSEYLRWLIEKQRKEDEGNEKDN